LLLSKAADLWNGELIIISTLSITLNLGIINVGSCHEKSLDEEALMDFFAAWIVQKLVRW
jgi:hypothetical protein